MIFRTLLSANALLFIAIDLAPTCASPVPERESASVELARRDYYNGYTSSLLESHWNEVRKRDQEAVEARKRDLPWNPSRLWGSGFSDGWGNYTRAHSYDCPTVGGRTTWHGWLIRTTTFYDGRTRDRSFWSNTSEHTNYDLPSTQTKCNLYGLPNYTTSKQCVDKIWNPTAKTWVARSSSNTNSYWTTNNATYHNHKVRTIFDCLLNRTAVEYGDNVTAFGFKPVQYELDDIKYYRFYDNNNFAWFVGCPTNWPGAWKRQIGDAQPHRLQKRCWSCLGINPVWDFQTSKERNPLADTTDINDYADNIHYPRDFNSTSRFVVMYWPPMANRNVTVDGHTCIQTAVSRPGLRHWTVRFFDEPNDGHVQQKDEYIPTEDDYAI
ncbi:hypothetical protein ABW20_dc0104509 [Dactylellina cionopaga]|nr:hypothetical protein ABW20_dc0104509 [Dactylellina cionopaga]